jgi:hypothetical protein
MARYLHKCRLLTLGLRKIRPTQTHGRLIPRAPLAESPASADLAKGMEQESKHYHWSSRVEGLCLLKFNSREKVDQSCTSFMVFLECHQGLDVRYFP